MSRVVRFHRLGGPEVLEIEELPDRPLKEGELRVRVEAIGLNRAEQMFRSGVIPGDSRTCLPKTATKHQPWCLNWAPA